MTIHELPEIRRSGRARGLRLVFGATSVPLRSLSRGGLSVEARSAPRLPGHVHIYAGDRHLASGLICCDRIDGDEHRFLFKRMTPSKTRPPRDYAPGGELCPVRDRGADRLRQGL